MHRVTYRVMNRVTYRVWLGAQDWWQVPQEQGSQKADVAGVQSMELSPLAYWLPENLGPSTS